MPSNESRSVPKEKGYSNSCRGVFHLMLRRLNIVWKRNCDSCGLHGSWVASFEHLDTCSISRLWALYQHMHIGMFPAPRAEKTTGRLAITVSLGSRKGREKDMKFLRVLTNLWFYDTVLATKKSVDSRGVEGVKGSQVGLGLVLETDDKTLFD